MSTKWQWGSVGCAFILLSVAGIGGCDENDGDPNVAHLNNGEVADDDDIDFTPVDHEVSFRMVGDNGENLNSAKLNSAKLNSAKLNSAKLNGTSIGNLDRLGSVVSGLQFQSGSLLKAFDEGSQSYRVGAQLIDVIMRVDIDGFGNNNKVKIANVTQSGLQPSVYFYSLLAETSPSVFETVCRDGYGTPTEAIPLPKAYDPDTAVRLSVSDGLTWACRGAALAKAVEWGYVPWVSPEMEDAHQAAMRMIRADYCGDGVTHTTNGNPIDVSDKWGIQTPDTTWPIEAKWGPDGAVCVSGPRKSFWLRSMIPCAASLPYCTNNGLANGTPNNDPAQYGGLLMTRAVPNNNPSIY